MRHPIRLRHPVKRIDGHTGQIFTSLLRYFVTSLLGYVHRDFDRRNPLLWEGSPQCPSLAVELRAVEWVHHPVKRINGSFGTLIHLF